MPFVSSRPKLELTKEELEFLTAVSRSRTKPYRNVERARFLLGYHSGATISAIARENHTNRKKIERTVDKALAFGVIMALDDKPGRGRKKIISSQARAWIVSLACLKPKELGYASELWTNRSLTKHIRNNCIEHGFNELTKISGGTVSKILSQSNIKPHKMAGYVQRRDPDFEEKCAKVLYIYKTVEMLREKVESKEPVYMAYISYDEKPGIQAIGNVAPDLPPIPGEHSSFSRDYEYKRYGTLSLLAGIDLLNGNIHAKVFDRHRSKEFIELLKHLDEFYSDKVRIVIFLDNHSAHTSKETEKYLLSVPNRFLFVFTPKHASWLNLIEGFFSKMARSFLRGLRVDSKEELKERILQYIDEVNEMPVVFKWKYKMDDIPGGIGSCFC